MKFGQTPSSETPGTQSRKNDHIRIGLEEDVNSTLTTGLEVLQLVHQALPEINLDDVDPSQRIWGRQLRAPLIISSMTGGTKLAAELNQRLAAAAQMYGIGMGVGSQRAAIEDESTAETFQVRKIAPDILLIANLGAVQLNCGYGVAECQRAVDMVEADALALHLNPVQEACQAEGDTQFAGLLSKIENVCRHLQVPVVVKEVGWGISKQTARQLESAGVAAIDVAGAGGTSWSQVEMFRAKSELQRRVAAAFRNWGIPTVEAIRQSRSGAPKTMIFASGGLRSGVDVAKCIALGATAASIAGPLLTAAADSTAATCDCVKQIIQELQLCMFATGSLNVAALAQAELFEMSPG